jgi:hypothetical protein
MAILCNLLLPRHQFFSRPIDNVFPPLQSRWQRPRFSFAPHGRSFHRAIPASFHRACHCSPFFLSRHMDHHSTVRFRFRLTAHACRKFSNFFRDSQPRSSNCVHRRQHFCGHSCLSLSSAHAAVFRPPPPPRLTPALVHPWLSFITLCTRSRLQAAYSTPARSLCNIERFSNLLLLISTAIAAFHYLLHTTLSSGRLLHPGLLRHWCIHLLFLP